MTAVSIAQGRAAILAVALFALVADASDWYVAAPRHQPFFVESARLPEGVLRAHLSVLPLPIPYRAFMDSFWAARKAAGMEHVHFHDLRHSFASMLINQGVDLYTVGKLLGHASPATTQRYAHLADAPLRAAVNKLR